MKESRVYGFEYGAYIGIKRSVTVYDEGEYQSFFITDGKRSNTVKFNCIGLCEGIREADLTVEMHQRIADILASQGLDGELLSLYGSEDEEQPTED